MTPSFATRTARLFMVAPLAMTLAVGGCATQAQRIGADDGSDVCRPQRVTLDATGDFFAEDIVKGAAIGAVTGGILGGLIGRDTKGALIGAASGAVLGAAGGYWKARSDQSRDTASLYSTISSDIARDNENIDKTQLAFSRLVDCRQAEANRIRADLRAGRITRPAAEQQMAGVRARSADDLKIARTVSERIEGRSADFAFANAQANPGAPTPTPSQPARPVPVAASQARPGTPAQVQLATNTNLAKRDQFKQSIATAESRQSSFELS